MNLTPFGIGAVIATALVGVLGQWSEIVGTLPWRLAALLLIVGLVHELRVTRRTRLTARLVGPERLYLGRAETLELQLENSSERAVHVQFVPLLPAALTSRSQPLSRPHSLPLTPHARRITHLQVRPLTLGIHEWQRLAARVRGPLKLAWWSRPLEVAATLRVLPDTLGPAGARVGTTDTGATTRPAPGGGRELHHLRPYRAGDPRHTIDWKASARSSGLISRVFTDDQHLEVLILLDAGRTSRTEIDGMSQLGHYANLAARLAEHCVAGDDQAGLIAFADSPLKTLAPARGQTAVRRVRSALAELDARAVESDVLTAALHARRLVRHRCLVLVLTDLYERSATSQLVQSARLLKAKHLPMIVGLMSEDVFRLAAQPATEWLDPYRSLAAREYQRHIAANVARLTRLGAHAMTARPRELDAKVLGRYSLLRNQRRI